MEQAPDDSESSKMKETNEKKDQNQTQADRLTSADVLLTKFEFLMKLSLLKCEIVKTFKEKSLWFVVSQLNCLL